MHRNALLEALNQYKNHWLADIEPTQTNQFKETINTVADFCRFVSAHENCFDRELLVGHVTGAAVITNPDLDQVLLTHHKKLNRWLQLGGHSDGDPITANVSLREAQEESGLSSFEFVSLAPVFGPLRPEPAIMDIDIHSIPARESEPEHLHLDVRYLLIAHHPEKIAISEESHALKWFTLAEAYGATRERSMHRQFEKLEFLRSFLN